MKKYLNYGDGPAILERPSPRDALFVSGNCGKCRPRGWATTKTQEQAYALGYATGAALPSPNSPRDTLSVAGYEERPLSNARGAATGAPKGNKNAYKHGRYTSEAIEERRILRAMLKAFRNNLAI
jgi:hypothetical protein